VTFPFNAVEPFYVLFPGDKKQIRCHISGTFRQQIIGGDPSLYLTFWPSGEAVVGGDSKLSKADAALVNFNQYRVGAGKTVLLNDGTWASELTPAEGTSRFPDDIQNKSYFFSHNLLLQKCDAQPFSWTEAQKCLATLSTFLSFCAGRSVAPALVRGYDQSGNVVIQDLGTPRVDPFGTCVSWLDEDHGGAMTEVFPGFAHLMEDEEWREAIRTAVYWYVRADTNSIGPDGAIVLIQTALEKLAWHILVRVRQSMSKDDFDHLPAAGQLRLVLDLCSVPLHLPPILKELTAVAKKQKGQRDWRDGPEAFADTRNQIVHPVKHKRVKGSRAFYEALQLGKWYLELIILHSARFDGSYACRLNIPIQRGNVEPVPWAKAKP
jgi:hypothetical protein